MYKRFQIEGAYLLVASQNISRLIARHSIITSQMRLLNRAGYPI